MIHKTTRSILSVLLAALLLVTGTPLTPAFADGGAVSPQSESAEGRALEQDGDGTYLIYTAENLKEFAAIVNGTAEGIVQNTSANAKLMNDIDLSSVCSEEKGVSWTPIGNSYNNAYTGTFNGDGHTISGLYIDSSDNDYKGLFGYLSTDGYNTGTVQNLSVSGSVKGNRYVGGVVGRNGGRITDCAFSGSVSGKISVGGVVGGNSGSNGVVENCYNTGTVTGTRTDDYLGGVGGVVGYNSGTVKNCYNTGKVTGSADSSDVGGVVGWNGSGSVENCYNTGSVTSSGNPLVGDVGMVGGVVGRNGGTVTGCYFLTGTAEKGIGVNEGNDSADATPVDDLDALCEKFENDPGWSIHPVLGRPVLNENWEGGDGTDKSPYQISNATELENFRDLVNGPSGQVKDSDAHAKLMNDINLSSVCGPMLDDGQPVSWIPIGTSSSNPYEGTFNGAGHTISGLYINSSSDSNQGLFGYVSGSGKIEKLSVSGTVSGGMYVGGVVGRNGGNVINCTFSGSVSGFGPVGGVVGSNNNGSVENCYNTGSVTGSADIVGGVVGYNSRSVTNCYNTGTVSGGEDVGGVVGHNDGGSGSGTVTNCYFLQTADVNVGRPGIGDGSGTSSNVEPRTADAFHSGEVAYLLGEAWGQNLMNEPKDNYPQLRAFDADTPQVYKVAFMNDSEEHDAQYANSGMTVGSPTTNPTKEGYTFAGWFTKSSGGSQWNFSTAVTENMTLYAQWTAVEEPDPDPEPTPEPEPEEPPYSGKYSYELTTSVGDHGALSVDRYATEGDKVTIDVTPDQAYKLDELVVTANGKDVELTANSDGTYTFTMPSADVRITATFAEDPDWTPDEPEEPTTDVSDLFIDIARDAWYKDAVQYAYDNGLMTGVSDTEFAPEATTTRAMIVSILARLEGVTTAEAAGFNDVTDEWYATAVNWAANVGVVNGYEDNTFRPNTAITREQLAAILMNYAAYKGQDVSARTDLDNYTDQPSTWAEEAMSWAVAEGLISGVTNTELQPQGNATRAQVAAILQRFLAQ